MSDALARRAHGSDDPLGRESLLRDLVEINVRVAHAVAARYRGRGIALEDLEQAACEGLIKAVHRFDPTQDHDLLSYAVPTIRGEVLRHFRDQGWMIRPPRRIQELQASIRRANQALALGREPTETELCDELKIDLGDYQEAMQAHGCFHPPSLDQPLDSSEGLTLADALPDETDTHSAVEARIVLSPVIRKLSDRERRILHLRFVLDQTQQEIGEQLGMHQVQVSRGIDKILAKLRADIGDPVGTATTP